MARYGGWPCQLICILVICCFGSASTEEWSLKSNDSCYEERGGMFPCSATITGNLILMLFYGALLGVAAKLISDGAEMLLDLKVPASLVGGVILPLLGAVPDSAIIVASGMGEDAQEKLAVGMGTLAGSTVMLLTVAWAGSLLIGRCDLNDKEEAIEQTGAGKFSLFKQGVTPVAEIRSGIFIMLGTSLLYFVIQAADWYFGVKNFTKQPPYVKKTALVTMILCLIGLAIYIVFSLYDSKRTDRIARVHREEALKRQVLHAMFTLTSINAFKPASPVQKFSLPVEADDDAVDGVDGGDGDVEAGETHAAVSKKYFKAWHAKKGMKALLKKNEENSNSADESEPFEDGEKPLLSGEKIEEEIEKEGEESKLKIACKSAGMLIAGVAIVTIFADPMCDVLTSLTNPKNKSYIPISAFYVSFVVTPFCSNASELVSSLIFAAKRKKENITLTYSQIFGACTMNNTMCLGIFMALVYFRDLEWYYSAEMITIVTCQWIVGLISLAKTYKVWLAVPIGSTYIFSIILVYLLEKVAGWK